MAEALTNQAPVVQFDANSLVLFFGLKFPQVDLILRGLGKLPHDEVADFIVALRGHALQQIQEAEAKAKATVQPQPPAEGGA
jgi:hypothetical protein